MSGSIDIKVTGPALADVRKLLGKIEDRSAAMRAVGMGAKDAYVRHFRALNAKHPNRLGGTRTNFWNQVAGKVHLVSSDKTKAVIGIGDPRIAHKVYGGTITPKRTKYLAIPVDASAHGKRPRTMADTALRIYGGRLFIVRKADGKPLFALKKSVTHRPQPDALPSMAAVAPSIVTELRETFGLTS